MPPDPKEILTRANAAIEAGDNERFLQFCTEDIEWEVVGDVVLRGKPAVREYMATEYAAPPRFTVTEMFSEGDLLTAMGELMADDGSGDPIRTRYCDVWRFRDGLMAELRAFVIEIQDDEPGV
jgi:ketosteroid isomerase-like protein